MAVVSGHKAELKEQLTEQTEFDILEDASLSANQCINETEDKMIDCSLDVQLQESAGKAAYFGVIEHRIQKEVSLPQR